MKQVYCYSANMRLRATKEVSGQKCDTHVLFKPQANKGEMANVVRAKCYKGRKK